MGKCSGTFAYAENDANVVVAGVVCTAGGLYFEGITAPSNPGIGSVVGTAADGAA